MEISKEQKIGLLVHNILPGKFPSGYVGPGGQNWEHDGNQAYSGENKRWNDQIRALFELSDENWNHQWKDNGIDGDHYVGLVIGHST